MKLYAVLIYCTNGELKYSDYNLEDFSFFETFGLKEKIENSAKSIIKTITTKGIYQINEKIIHREFTIYGSWYDTYCIVITDKDYPSHLSLELLQLLNKNNSNTELTKLFDTYQNPLNIDKITLIQKELEDTKLVIYDSIDKLINRGEELNTLTDKTEILARESETFRIEATRMNECCVIF